MAGFTYSTARETVEAAKNIAIRYHQAEIIGHNAMLNVSDDPMLIVRFKISDDNDPDDSKEVAGFINFNYTDLSLETIDAFCGAVGLDPVDEFGGEVIDVPFLAKWGEQLLGEMLNIYVGYGKGEYANKPVVRGTKENKPYMPLGNAPKASTLIDLD
jgi:hypothetical protein